MSHDIYHITHVNNLANIIQNGFLFSDAQRIQKQIENHNIGYSHIKKRRLKHPVSVARKGFIGDYVPFNFCPRSVMLLVVSKGHENYHDGQDNIIHLVTDTDKIRKFNTDCFFTNTHADLAYAEQIDDFARLNELNWDAINEYYWPSVKEEKQAEFLAYNSVSWQAIKEIGIKNATVQQQVNQILSGCQDQPLVQVQTQWYY